MAGSRVNETGGLRLDHTERLRFRRQAGGVGEILALQSERADLASGPRERPTRSLLRIVVEATSFGLIVAFIISAWINQTVFYSWGLSFRSLATTTDVVMSGLTFFFGFALPALFVSALVSAIVSQVKGRLETAKRWHKWSAPILLLVGVGVLNIVIVIKTDSGVIMFDSALSDVDTAFAFVAMLSIASIILHFLLRGYQPVENREPVFADRGFRVVSSLALMGIIIAVGGITYTRMQVGYLDAYVPVGSNTARCEEGSPHLLWVGSQFSVIGCPDTNFAAAIRTDTLSPVVPDLRYGLGCRRVSAALLDCDFYLRKDQRSTPPISAPEDLPVGVRGIVTPGDPPVFEDTTGPTDTRLQAPAQEPAS